VSAITREMAASLDYAREAFERAAVGLIVVSPDGVFRQANPAFCAILGRPREEVEGSSFRRFTHPDDVALDEQHLALALANQDLPPAVEKRFMRPDGTEVWVRRRSTVVRDASGNVRFIVTAITDLTEQRAKDQELAHAANELERHLHFTRALLDAIPNPVYFQDTEGRYQAYNRAWADVFGRGEEWAGRTVGEMFPPDLAALHQERDRMLLDRPSSTTYEAVMPTGEGDKRQMLYNKVSFVDQRGEVAGVIGVVTDVTHYKETERALEASEARFRVLTESSLDLISIIHEDGTILYQSGALRTLVGYDPADTIGKSVYDLIHRDDVEVVREAIRRVVDGLQSHAPIEFRMRHRDGVWRTFESLGTNCLGNPHIGGVVFNSRDVTDRKVIQQRIQHLAYHDNLTGLPNRSLLQDRLQHSIARAERAGRKVAVLFIDLDNFKNINDTLGHDVGDELLRQVSRRLTECVRLEDTIARQGGDEFIVLLDSLDDSRGASVVAQKVLNSLRQPFVLGGGEQHVSGSVGIALYPEDGKDAQTLMKNADTAMFHGKSLGKNTYQYFTPQMNIAVKRRMTLESALRRAVMQKDFVLNYQPQINLETGEIIAVEALVRWKTEDSGTVMPGDFIPLAEETGLINEIGEWVLREGCRQAREWQDLGLSKERRIAINLSARQFGDRAFLDMVTRVLQDTKLDASCLELEITESQVMRQTEGMIQLLNRLAEMGVHLAIDDFGTGYSSLSYLKRLPIQKLKIDQSFIRDITVDPNDTAIVVAIINMAKSLDLETIAEGVETAGQLALLRSKGCRVGQGFYFAAPLRAEALYPLLKQNNMSPHGRGR
jgi:diguanylate cyclase (GGDEF)-like protein/PAS domain S-box-containing protein